MPENHLRIPYVIDNIETRLADVLNALLQRQHGQMNYGKLTKSR